MERTIDKNAIYDFLADTGWDVTVADRNAIKFYIKEHLRIPQMNWGVRWIYIKLFLEGKINEEDLRQLILSRDNEINLYSLLPENYWPTYDDYVFINNLW